jgi:hypothetical protein
MTDADFTKRREGDVSFAMMSREGVVVAQLDIDHLLIDRDGSTRIKAEVARWLGRLDDLGILK